MLAISDPRTGTGDAVMASRRAGRSGPLPRASVTGVPPEVHLRYTAGIWRMVKGAAPPFFQLARTAYPESGSRKFWYLRVPRKGAETGFI